MIPSVVSRYIPMSRPRSTQSKPQPHRMKAAPTSPTIGAVTPMNVPIHASTRVRVPGGGLGSGGVKTGEAGRAGVMTVANRFPGLVTRVRGEEFAPMDDRIRNEGTLAPFPAKGQFRLMRSGRYRI